MTRNSNQCSTNHRGKESIKHSIKFSGCKTKNKAKRTIMEVVYAGLMMGDGIKCSTHTRVPGESLNLLFNTPAVKTVAGL